MIWAFKEGIKVYSYKDENYSNVDEQENINKFLNNLNKSNVSKHTR